MTNLLSSDQTVLIDKLSLCDYDIRVNPDYLVFNILHDNSETATLSGTGTLLSKLQADVKISTNPSNLLEVDSTGLLVLFDPTEDTDELTKVTTNDTAAGYLFDKIIGSDNIEVSVNTEVSGLQQVQIDFIGEIPTTILTADSSTTTLSGDGDSGTPVFVDVLISADSDNILTVESDGLFVPSPSAQTPISVTDSTSLDFTISGLDSHSLTGAVKISPDADNALEIRVNGLYATEGSGGSETSLSVTDTTTVDLTASGTANHTLSAAVKLSATGGNILIANGDGLYVPTPSSPTVYTSSNGITKASDNFKLGGSLIQDTLFTGTFDVAFANRKVILGNTYLDNYGDASADANTRSLFVRNAVALSSSGNGSVNSYYNLLLNGTGSFGSGRSYVGTDSGLKLTVSSSYTVPNSVVVAGAYNILQIENTAAGNLTVDASRPIAACASAVLPLSGYASNTGVIGHVAAFYATPIFQSSGGTDFTEITNYYGLFLAPSDDIIVDGAKVVNKYGINQVGTNDDNIFRGDISYYGALTNASDARIKDNITSFTDGLDAINKIDTVEFEYIGKYKRKENQRYIGVIAQDLEKVLPKAVKVQKDGDFEDFRTVDQSVLIFTLINAVKELSAQIEELKSQK